MAVRDPITQDLFDFFFPALEQTRDAARSTVDELVRLRAAVEALGGRIDALGQQLSALAAVLSRPAPAPPAASPPAPGLPPSLELVLRTGQAAPDMILRLVLAAERYARASARVVQAARTVGAGQSATFIWSPDPGRILRVLGGLDVDAEPHSAGVLASLYVDGRPVYLQAPLRRGLFVESYLVPSAGDQLVLTVENQTATTVDAMVGAVLVDIDPDFYLQVIRTAAGEAADLVQGGG